MSHASAGPPGAPSFKDHFSGHAHAYALHRPVYPAELFDWLAGAAPGRTLAWDAATGNGQAACALAERFANVHASDASSEQLAAAAPCARVRYAVEPAESCSLPDHSTDLLTVAQALHWFTLERFWPEAHRVLRPGGLFCAWTYGLNRVSPEVDAVVQYLYEELLGAYWPPERRHVESGYRDLALPFAEVEAPAFAMCSRTNLQGYLAYLRTWSAVQRCVLDSGQDPVAEVEVALQAAWGDPAILREVDWPLSLRAGYKRD